MTFFDINTIPFIWLAGSVMIVHENCVCRSNWFKLRFDWTTNAANDFVMTKQKNDNNNNRMKMILIFVIAIAIFYGNFWLRRSDHNNNKNNLEYYYLNRKLYTYVESSHQSFFFYHLNYWIFWIYCVITTHQVIPISDNHPINETMEIKNTNRMQKNRIKSR